MAAVNPNQASVQAIKAAAAKYGLDPQAMIAVARVESGLNPSAVGDNGHAFGLFQFNNAGGVITGDPHPEKYLNPSYNALAAARHIANIKGARGATGADAIRLIVNKFERPANRQGEISKALAYYGAGAQGGGIPTPTVSTASQGASNALSPSTNSTGSIPATSPLEQLLAYTMAGSTPSHNPGTGDPSAGLMGVLMQPQDTIPAPTVIGTTPTIPAQPGAPTTQPTFTPTGGYSALTTAKFAGNDQGVDFTGPGPVRALGDGIITKVAASGTGWPGQGALVVYKLTSGPHAGEHVYMAEDLIPAGGLKPGTKITRGQVIAQATGSAKAPGIEVGFAQNSRGQAYGTTRDGKSGGPNPVHGKRMADFIASLSKGGVNA